MDTKARAKFVVTLHLVGDAPKDKDLEDMGGLIDEAIQRQSDNVGITPEDYDGFAEMFSVELQGVEY